MNIRIQTIRDFYFIHLTLILKTDVRDLALTIPIKLNGHLGISQYNQRV